jgi:hypothetical protein
MSGFVATSTFFTFEPVARSAVVNRKVLLAPDPNQQGKWQVIPQSSPQRSPASGGSLESSLSPNGSLPSADASSSVDMASPDSLSPDALSPSSNDSSGVAESLKKTRKKPKPIDWENLPVLRETLTKEMVDSLYPKPMQNQRSWRVGFGGDLALTLTDRQVGTLTVGYQKGFMDFFLRGRFGNTLWGLMEVRPTAADSVDTEGFPAFEDPDSEYNRARLTSDPWSVMDVQLGFGSWANLLPVIFPNFSQGFAFTIATGSYADVRNSLQFSSLLFGLEASTQWHFGVAQSWAIEGKVSYNFGALNRVGASTASLGRLPVRWVDAGLSLIYWF